MTPETYRRWNFLFLQIDFYNQRCVTTRSTNIHVRVFVVVVVTSHAITITTNGGRDILCGPIQAKN